MIFLPLLILSAACAAKPEPADTGRTPLLITHYMPWYSNKEVSGKWGWHWTMNHFDPDNASQGRQQAASNYRPLIRLYDSSDPAVLEYHALLMKFAGLDGAALDWYGVEDYYDYATNNRNDQLMADELQKAGLKFTLVYEDQTVNQEIKGGLFSEDQAVARGAKAFDWLQNGWFKSANYLKLGGDPVVLVFGPQYYKDDDWNAIFANLNPPPAFFTLMFKRGPAIGGFSWPTPQRGEAKSWDELTMFDQRSQSWQAKIGVAYPRFNDIYKEAGLSGFPTIEDHDGQTLEQTFDRALAPCPFMIQIATWNDWGEGTQIEPSVEFGFRDLEILQTYRKKLTPSFSYTANDLRLPLQLFRLRKEYKHNSSMQAKLNHIADALDAGNPSEARAQISHL